MEKIIKKVCINKKSGQKFITIPKNCELVKGDYVAIVKVELVIK